MAQITASNNHHHRRSTTSASATTTNSSSNAAFIRACGYVALIGWTVFVSSPNFSSLNQFLAESNDAPSVLAQQQQQHAAASDSAAIYPPVLYQEGETANNTQRSSSSMILASPIHHHQQHQQHTTPLKKLLPDWRLAVDCSVFDYHCFSVRQSQGLYEDYPFPYTRSSSSQQQQLEDAVEWETILEVPSDWKNHLLSSPEPRTIQYIYPPKASQEQQDQCLQSAQTMSWQDQLDQLFNANLLIPEPDTNMVAFTISDYNYAKDMIHDFFEMNDHIVGFAKALFLVAIDYETLELACRYNYPVIAWPSAVVVVSSSTNNSTSNDNNNNDNLKAAVANTKLELSYALVQRKQSFFFYEMDVWFIKSPKSIIQQFTGDILFSSHQNCPKCINIGVYSVVANPKTAEYFKTCIELAKVSNNTHDQKLMAGVIGIGVDRKGFSYGKHWDPKPDYVPRLWKPVTHGFFSPHEIIADERPYTSQMAVAFHPLRSQPLKSPHGKMILAKESGVWYGFEGPNGEAGYYKRQDQHRRYLWMDGHILNGVSTVMNWEFQGEESGLYHDFESFKWTIATLIALARRTGRIFILPRVLQDRGIHFLWTLLDMESVEALVDVRETNFPNNPKAWYNATVPFGSVARTALGNFQTDQTMFAQYPSNNSTTATMTTRAWRFPQEANTTRPKPLLSPEGALDSWWALQTAIPEIDYAELLLVNPHFINMHYVRPLHRKMRTTRGRRSTTTDTIEEEYVEGVAEYEIASVFYQLRWCTKDNKLDRVVGVFKADDDCYGRGIGS